jgi:hypothetical protein
MNIIHLSGDDCITLTPMNDILKLRSYNIFYIKMTGLVFLEKMTIV